MTKSQARALLDGDRDAAARLAALPLKPLPTNFVERPWGGLRIREYKGVSPLDHQPRNPGAGLGEAFEIAAYDADEEARQYPSILELGDGSRVSLPELLATHGETLLGREFVARHGACFPLLPKTLDVAELLSVQGHPEGNPEAYLIIDADPGATLRLGFARDIDPEPFKRELTAGRADQQRLLDAVTLDAAALQTVLKPWLAARDDGVERVLPAFAGKLAQGVEPAVLVPLLERLKALYWSVLDSMNAIPVRAGQVIYNANPPRIAAAAGKAPSAEVHALGNPEGREILALEVRRPGPTFRAWDNVRFPLRAVDVDAAIDALNLRRTAPEEFLVEPQPVAGRRGVFCSVDGEAFRIEHLRPRPGALVDVPAEPPHCLHLLAGEVALERPDGTPLASLRRGEAALVPIGVGAYRARALGDGVELIKASVPV